MRKRNITVSVPEPVYRRARIRAAEQNSSVSELVRGFLERLSQADSDFERRRRLQHEVMATLGTFRAADRLSREAIHDRDAVR